MNKFYMSLDEVGKNEFYIACLYLVKDIIAVRRKFFKTVVVN